MTWDKLKEAELLKERIERVADAITMLDAVNVSSLTIETVKFNNGETLYLSQDSQKGGVIISSGIADELLKKYRELYKNLQKEFEQL